MSRRIVFLVSAMLFTLVALVANILTDVHDRNFPDELQATSSVYLDFSRSGLSDPDALSILQSESRRLDVGLFKVQPNMTGDRKGQNFVRLGPSPLRDGTLIRAYGDQPAGVVAGPKALAHSFATGAYLGADSTKNLDQFVAGLTADGVIVKRVDDSGFQTANFVLKQGTFRNALLAVITLMTSMALFWLSIRAKARALRVLGGVSTSQIQVHDLGTFMLAVVAATIPVTGFASLIVGLTHGWIFVPTYLTTLVTMQVIIALLTAAIALGISCVSWPSARLLARREPPVKSLRRASTILKAVTFLLVIGSAGPAWLSYRDASSVAAQQAQWTALADQVALRYPAGLGEAGFERIRTRVGQAVAKADAKGHVALSYSMTPEQLGVQGFGRYSTVAIVNPQWLRLMLQGGAAEATRAVSRDALPAAISQSIANSLPVWTSGAAKTSSIDSFTFRATNGSNAVPLAQGGNGDLLFKDNALLMVVPDVAATFNADFLASLTSSSNLVFDGLDATIATLRAVGLEQTVRVVYVAEDGILRAQYTAYMAWLRAIAMIALALAFIIAASVSALIAALLAVRRDFPLRISGRSWPNVISPRVARETFLGTALAVGIVLVQPPATLGPVAAAAVGGLLLTPLLHLAAARWCFTNLSLRRS